MHRGHGDAERLMLLAEDVELEGFDEIVRSGGTGVDARREARVVLENAFTGPGRFGKLFPDLDAFRPPDAALVELGLAMRELAPEDPALNNSDVPAGFTYLGQFVDHDITFDQTQGFPEINDPDEIKQARTPTLDLDSLYGLGPRRQPELFLPGVPASRARFRVGRTAPEPSPGGQAPGTPPVPGGRRHDLPRSPVEATIGDPRNDENLVVAQVHLQFLKFHNRVIARLPGGMGARDDGDDGLRYTVGEEPGHIGIPYMRARRLVRWHYQWLVLHDFLPRLIDQAVLDDIRENGRRFYRFDGAPFDGEPFMPLEFSVAGYRLGHSMIREVYDYNRVFARPSVEPNALTPATLGLLFTFTGSGGGAPIPGNWACDFRRFFELEDPGLLNFARRYDTQLIPQLHELPGNAPSPDFRSLAVRNLVRGSRVGLPTGQAVAEAMGVEALTPAELTGGEDGPIVREHGFDRTTPLWYYILKEASVQAEGKRLGAVGSRIVGEVFFGLLDGDPHSYVRQEPGWSPTLPASTPGDFTMADLLRLVNEINPVG